MGAYEPMKPGLLGLVWLHFPLRSILFWTLVLDSGKKEWAGNASTGAVEAMNQSISIAKTRSWTCALQGSTMDKTER